MPSVGRAISLESEWPLVICCLWLCGFQGGTAPVLTSPVFLAQSRHLAGTSDHSHLETLWRGSLAHEGEGLEKPGCVLGKWPPL